MKRQYMKPTASAFAFQTEGVFAVSPGDTKNISITQDAGEGGTSTSITETTEIRSTESEFGTGSMWGGFGE